MCAQSKSILPCAESSFFDVLLLGTCQILTLPWVTFYLRILLDYYANFKTKGAKVAEKGYPIYGIFVEQRRQVVRHLWQSLYLTSAG